jgi:hypothetical protein
MIDPQSYSGSSAGFARASCWGEVRKGGVPPSEQYVGPLARGPA